MDDGTVLLVCNTPWDKFGHGVEAFEPWHDPRTGRWYMRCPVIAAHEFCLRGGCYLAPDQEADR